MEKLIKIAGQQFYYSTVKDLEFFQKEKCAIIIDEIHLDELLNSRTDLIKGCVSQLIIIVDELNVIQQRLKNENVFLLAATNFEEAIRFAVLSVELNTDVICMPKKSKEELSEVMNLLIV